MKRVNCFEGRNFAYIVLIIILLFTISTCIHVTEQSEPPSEIMPIDPRLTIGTLDNGLTYYIRHNPKPENRAELRLIVNAGSVLEEEDQQGLAHFLEHMAFNGTLNFKKDEIVDFLESLGMRFGPDLNAHTGFDQTVYYLQVPTATQKPEVLKTAVQILEDWAHNISFDEAEIEKERPIIIEEWRLGRGAEARMRDKQFPILFKDSRYAERRPIGKLEIIKNCGSEQFLRFYRDWYRPDLMAVIAVGDFDKDWMEEIIVKHFSRLKMPDDPRERKIYQVPDHKEIRFAVASDPEATSTRVGIYTKHEVSPFYTVEDYRRRIVEYLYSGMLNDRLEELTKRSDPPFLSAYSGNLRTIRSKELYILGARVKDNGILRGLEALLTETERARRFGFTETELKRQKDRILTWIETAYNERENTESRRLVAEYEGHFLEDEPIPGIEYEYELFKRVLPVIKLEEVNQQALLWLTDENRVIMVNAPEKPEVEIPGEDELEGIFNMVKNKAIQSYRDEVKDEPLISGPLTLAMIEETVEIPELELTEWRLSNGVRVILKPTLFKNDQVLFAAFSPGGHSLIPDEDYVAAVTASSVIAQGGVGDFNQIELQKKLTGRLVQVSPWISELHEGIQGKARPDDLETMFQLIYLFFTAPRRDESAFLSYREQLAADLKNRKASPETVFWDTVRILITQNHYRARPWDLKILKEMSLDVSYSVYQNRFKDAGDFTFFFVGNFTLKGIEPLIRKYLGSLPSTGRIESWRDLGIDPPGGVIEQIVKRGLEPKSRVQIIFSGSITWSFANKLKLRALAEVLEIQLRDTLREDSGGTYSVGVLSSISHYPDEEYHVYIGFGCAPENAEDLSASVLTQIESLQSDGPKDEEINKVKEIFKRERETDLKKNEFWLQNLQFYYAHDLDTKDILQYEANVDAINAQMVQKTAQKYLDINRYVKVLLYPENWEDREEAE